MAFPGGKSLSSNWNDTLGEGGVNGQVFEMVPGERCEPAGQEGREGGGREEGRWIISCSAATLTHGEVGRGTTAIIIKRCMCKNTVAMCVVDSVSTFQAPHRAT